jgi:hypothetical protein
VAVGGKNAVTGNHVVAIYSCALYRISDYPPKSECRKRVLRLARDSLGEVQKMLLNCTGDAMKKQYRFAELSEEEKEYHEMLLLEEVDVQAWFAIAYSSIFSEELFVTVQ